VPFGPTLPSALDDGSRIDEHAVQIEKECAAGGLAYGRVSPNVRIKPMLSCTTVMRLNLHLRRPLNPSKLWHRRLRRLGISRDFRGLPRLWRMWFGR
jgi:hypothetical protein